MAPDRWGSCLPQEICLLSSSPGMQGEECHFMPGRGLRWFSPLTLFCKAGSQSVHTPEEGVTSRCTGSALEPLSWFL